MEDTPLLNTFAALSHDFALAVERVARSVVAVHARHRIPSTGVVWREGIVVTAAHTVKRDEDISIKLSDGTAHLAHLVGRDPGTDLAVLKVDGLALPVAETADAAALRVGNLVLALGAHGEQSASASLALVGSLGGPWRSWRGGQIDRLIRLDAGLLPGFSGGPAVDATGRVAGIVTAGLSRHAAIAIPPTTVDRVAGELLDRGRVARGFLGISLMPVWLPEPLAQLLGLGTDRGVIVLGVDPDGPAGKAGMMLGDVVVAIEGAPIRTTDDVQAQLGGERVGNPLTVSLVRAGERFDVTVTVGEWPQGGR